MSVTSTRPKKRSSVRPTGKKKAARPRSVLQTLIALRKWFAGGKRWTQNTFAVDSEGLGCDTGDPCTAQTCLLGGVYHVLGQRRSDSNELFANTRQALVDTLRTEMAPGRHNLITHWNDSRSREWKDINELIRKTIAARKAGRV